MLQNVGVGAGILLDLGQQHVGQVQGDPVEHDARNDFIYITVGFEQAGDGAQNGAAQHGQQHTGQPAPVPRQRRIQADGDPGTVLTRHTDIKEAHLVGKQDRQCAHKKRCGFYQRVAEILGLCFGAAVGQKVFYDGGNGFARTIGIDEQQHDIAQQHTQHYAGQGCQQRLYAVVFPNVLFHAVTLPLLAPAM